MSNNPNKWLPMAIPLPAGKQVEVKATGQNKVIYDQATMLSDEVQFIGPHGFKWTHWRLTENNEKTENNENTDSD